MKELGESYNVARNAHNNKFGKAESLRTQGSEAPYRESANRMKEAYESIDKKLKFW